jgi:hypothetical protein
VGDFCSQGLAGALDLLGFHADSGQFVEQLAALGEADPRSRLADHARDRRRQGAAPEAQRLVPWTESASAGGAVVVGALERDRAQRRDEGLFPAASVAGLPATSRTGQGRPAVVGEVGVELLLDHQCGHRQSPLPRSELDRLEAQPVDDARSYERLDLGDDLSVEGFLEPPFSAAVCSAVAGMSASSLSAHRSQARQYASTSRRNARPAASCSRALAACSADRRRDWVPLVRERVRLKYGPCRAASSVAHAQRALPHLVCLSPSEPRRIGRGC